jgi:hypothetical protein
MRTVAHVFVDTLFVVAHGSSPPSEAEWGEFLDDVKRQGPGMRHLIFTAGGAPTKEQRQQVEAVLAGWTPAAYVTDVARIRLAVRAAAWPGRRVRAYAPEALDEALYFLGVPIRRRDFVRGKLDEVRAQVGDDGINRRCRDGG